MGKIGLIGVSAEAYAVLLAREQFVKAYCEKMGWRLRDLSMRQVMEIRAQDGWKEPAREVA